LLPLLGMFKKQKIHHPNSDLKKSTDIE